MLASPEKRALLFLRSDLALQEWIFKIWHLKILCLCFADFKILSLHQHEIRVSHVPLCSVPLQGLLTPLHSDARAWRATDSRSGDPSALCQRVNVG